MGKTSWFAALSLVIAASAYAAAPHWHSWTAATTAKFPVVPVYTCPNTFAADFPGIPASVWEEQVRHATDAMFTTGGSNLRLRWEGSLDAGDPKCALGTQAPQLADPGTILVRSEPVATNCSNIAMTFTQFWNGDIVQATIKIYPVWSAKDGNNNACTGTNDFGDGQFPGPSQLDTWSVLLHELGHAVGIDHAVASMSAVMYPYPFLGPAGLKRTFEAGEDFYGLRDGPAGYGPIRTFVAPAASANGRSWTPMGYVLPFHALGRVAACHRPPATAGLFDNLIAWTDPAQTNVLNTATWDIVSGRLSGTRSHNLASHFGPGAACSDEGYVVAVAGREVRARWSSDGVDWVDSVINCVGCRAAAAPVLAYSRPLKAFVLAWAQESSGRISVLYSFDGGKTFTGQRCLEGPTTHFDFGMQCSGEKPVCELAYAETRTAGTSLHVLELEFSGGRLGVVRDADTRMPAYAAAVAWWGGRWQFGWRDAGRATVLASSGWTSPPRLEPASFTDPVHASPSIHYAPALRSWLSIIQQNTSYED